MSTIRVQVTIPRKDALPADAIVNTFHWFKVGAVNPATDGDAIIDALVDAWTVDHGDGFVLTTAYASYMKTEDAWIKMYDLADPEPRAPIRSEALPLTAAGSGELPAEVALCMSYAVAPESGAVAARNRGRIYFGPFSDSRDQIETNVDSRPANALRGALSSFGSVLIAASTADLYWTVYSEVDATAQGPVTHGWVDNAWDTQRRRGAAANLRSTFP
jgi:hypothetical protein